MRGTEVQILTGTYLSITEPPPVTYYLPNLLKDSVEIRLIKERSFLSFHPKSYISDYDNDLAAPEVYVGSSNILAVALGSGVEWNCRIGKRTAPADCLRKESRKD